MAKRLSYYFIMLVLLGLVVTATHAKVIDGYGGYMSTDRIDQGDEMMFSGSVHNFHVNPIYVVFMNVSFLEELGPGATRDPDLLNITKSYDTEDRQFIGVNTTFTDVLITEVDFEPGSYLVSIFFIYSNTSDVSPGGLGTLYTMANQSLIISGTTQALQAAKTLGYILVGAAAVIIGLLVYRRFKS